VFSAFSFQPIRDFSDPKFYRNFIMYRTEKLISQNFDVVPLGAGGCTHDHNRVTVLSLGNTQRQKSLRIQDSHGTVQAGVVLKYLLLFISPQRSCKNVEVVYRTIGVNEGFFNFKDFDELNCREKFIEAVNSDV
jgi:hypothetical protein